jgi:glycine cleavage system H protein
MKINDFEYREGRFYTKKHLWVLVKGKQARIGLDAFYISHLGDISDIELTYIDNECEKDDAIATVYSDSDTLDILPPFPGKITNVNEELEDDPTFLMEDPYGKGWLVEMLISEELNLDHFMQDDEAESWYRAETEKE